MEDAIYHPHQVRRQSLPDKALLDDDGLIDVKPWNISFSDSTSSGDDDERDEPIREATEDCVNFLSRLLAQIDPTGTFTQPKSLLVSPSLELTRLIEDLNGSFEAWIMYTGAMATDSDRSLDIRLRESKDIKTIIIELLQMLGRNLNYLSSLGENKTLWNESVGFIQHVIDELHFVADVIGKSSVRAQHHSVSSEFKRHYDNHFENSMSIIIRRQFPEARHSLCNQLAVSVTQRRTSMVLRIHHEMKLKPEKTPSPIPQRKTKASPIEIIGSPHLNPASSTPISLMHEVGRSVVRTGSVDTRSVFIPAMARHRLHKRPSASTISMGSSMSSGERQYPPSPELPQGAMRGVCRYCFKRLPVLKLKTKEEWNKHMDEDVQPYVCLSENCRSPLLFFSHMKDWIEHMNSLHSEQWNRKIHMSTWECDLGHASEQFGNLEDFRSHMKDKEIATKSHGRPPPTDLQLDTLSRTHQRFPFRETYSCPLCDCVPGALKPVVATSQPKAILDKLHKHIAGHLKDLAILSIPDLGTTNNVDQVSDKLEDWEKGGRLKSGETAFPPSGFDEELRNMPFPEYDDSVERPDIDIPKTLTTY